MQALPAQSAGGVAVGSGLPSSPGTLGPSPGVPGAPRSIHVHIHTSDPGALIAVPSSSVSAPPRAFSFEEHVRVPAGGSGLSMRQLLERGDPRNAAHGGAGANHGSGGGRANRWSNDGGNGANPVAGSLSSGPSGMQGALMTFDENGAMRVVPVRSRGGGHGPSGNNGDPLLARFQHQFNFRPVSNPPNLAPAGAGAAAPYPPASASSESPRQMDQASRSLPGMQVHTRAPWLFLPKCSFVMYVVTWTGAHQQGSFRALFIGVPLFVAVFIEGRSLGDTPIDRGPNGAQALVSY